MQRADFHFELPDELIARYPSEQRSDCRLLCVDGQSGALAHRRFPDLLDLLEPGDLLVFNDTRVIPARLHGHKASGGKVEMLLERPLDSHRGLAHIRSSKSPKPGTELIFEGDIHAVVEGRRDALFELRFLGDTPMIALLEKHGHMPLPPYIKRGDKGDPRDTEDYQTLFADKPGAVVAPTAGLHFTPALLETIKAAGVGVERLTLHVGAGTFLPVKADDTDDHRMHAEWGEITPTTAVAANAAKDQGGRVIAVGSTVLRLLEAAADGDGLVNPFSGETDIFITPGYRFRIVDGLLTNFHLPCSTLFMLVAAFSGLQTMKAVYEHAKAAGYRFYSYGDACFLERSNQEAERTGGPTGKQQEVSKG